MATRHQWKRRLIITEILSLLILIASLYWLGQDSPDQTPINPYWLLVPALASLVTFLSFLSLMYLRWTESAVTGPRQRVQQILFGIMVLMLLSIWALAITQTWQSLNRTTDISLHQ